MYIRKMTVTTTTTTTATATTTTTTTILQPLGCASMMPC